MCRTVFWATREKEREREGGTCSIGQMLRSESCSKIYEFNETTREELSFLELRPFLLLEHVSTAQPGFMLHTLQEIVSTDAAFAALLTSGAVVTWGGRNGGADSSEVQHRLRNSQHQWQTSQGDVAVSNVKVYRSHSPRGMTFLVQTCVEQHVLDGKFNMSLSQRHWSSGKNSMNMWIFIIVGKLTNHFHTYYPILAIRRIHYWPGVPRLELPFRQYG